MKLYSNGIVNGKFLPKYGKYGTQFNKNDMPNYSIPFSIEDAPENTVSYALLLEDKGAYPVCGFSWVHWLAANITRTEILENESVTAKDFVQGANSWISIQGGKQSIEESSYYGGMAPPNAPHRYELHVYALDTLLDLNNGFLLDEMFEKMRGHVLDCATISGIYDN